MFKKIETISKGKVIFIICFIQIFIWALAYFSVGSHKEIIEKFIERLNLSNPFLFIINWVYLVLNFIEIIFFVQIIYFSYKIKNYLQTIHGQVIFRFFVVFGLIRILIYSPLLLYFSGLFDLLTYYLPIIYRKIFKIVMSYLTPVILGLVSNFLYDFLKGLYRKIKRVKITTE